MVETLKMALACKWMLVEPRAGPDFQAEPSPEPIPSAKPRQMSLAEPWPKPHRIPIPQPISSWTPNRAHSWAEPSIKLIPESPAEPQAEPEPRARMRWVPNSEPSRAELRCAEPWAEPGFDQTEPTPNYIQAKSSRGPCLELSNKLWVKSNSDS